MKITKNTSSIKGAGLLEMLMFTPIALLLIFSGTNTGLRFIEQQAVSDALRASLRGEWDYKVFKSDLEGNAHLSYEAISQNTEKRAALLFQNILSLRESLPGSASLPYAAEVSAVLVRADSVSGQLIPETAEIYHSTLKGNEKYRLARDRKIHLLGQSLIGVISEASGLGNNRTQSNKSSDVIVYFGTVSGKTLGLGLSFGSPSSSHKIEAYLLQQAG